MTISQSLLGEFDSEMANTRRTLERVPEDKLSWKPHERSFALGRLAAHIAEAPGWSVPTIAMDELDISPVGTPPYQPFEPKSRQEILDYFDKQIAAAREAIAGASDDHLRKPWTLLAAGKTMFTMPRIAVLRGMIMNHTIHHRAQLTVYLRLLDIPVPALYGPSADEGQM
jgi:uncharacterized damage-inducible protein DinB